MFSLPRWSSIVPLTLVAACAVNPDPSAESPDGENGLPALGSGKNRDSAGGVEVGQGDEGGDCFGVPRAPGELCPVETVSDELDSPYGVAVRDGVAYVATKGSLVRIGSSGIERLADGYGPFGVDAVVMEGDWLVWRTGWDLFRAPLSNPTASEKIAENVCRALSASGGHISFGTGDCSDKGGPLVRAPLSSPQKVELVTPRAQTGLVASDGSSLYFFTPNSLEYGYRTELRRVSATGGDGERISTIEDESPWVITVTPEFVFFATARLHAARKTGGTALRTVFEREGESVMAVTSDTEGVYFATSTDDAIRIYRSSLDGKTVRLLGQAYGRSGIASIAVDGDALFVTASLKGVLLKLPKQ